MKKESILFGLLLWLHFNLQITSGYYGLDLEADQPRMNVEVRVTMTEL